jgi:hypothetical protein
MGFFQYPPASAPLPHGDYYGFFTIKPDFSSTRCAHSLAPVSLVRIEQAV